MVSENVEIFTVGLKWGKRATEKVWGKISLEKERYGLLSDQGV